MKKKVSGDLSGDLSGNVESGNVELGEKSKESKPTRLRASSLAVTREIDENLKRVYQEALIAEVPDRFAKLLAQLREKEGKS